MNRGGRVISLVLGSLMTSVVLSGECGQLGAQAHQDQWYGSGPTGTDGGEEGGVEGCTYRDKKIMQGGDQSYGETQKGADDGRVTEGTSNSGEKVLET